MRVLLIAPKCFPIEGAESIVNIKMLQAFAQDDDIEVDVVSRRHRNVVYPSDSLDQYHVRVRKLCIIESDNRLNLKTIWQTLLCFLIFGSGFKGSVWAIVALPTVKRLVRNNCYDFVLTKSSPSFLLGAYLKKQNIPWVASWNDPAPSGFYPAPYGKDSDHRPSLLEQLILRQMRKADYHVFPSQQLLEHMVSYLHVDKSVCCVIPHAIIPDNRSNDTVRLSNDSNCGVMKIIHSGNLASPRNPTSFFSAVNNVLEQNPDFKIQVTVLGRVANEVLPSESMFPALSKCFTCIPPLEYNQALKLLTEYDLACIIEANTKVGKAVFLPTKVTDFMQMGIPIMSVSPRGGVLHNMYRNGNIGYFCDVADVKSIEKALISAYQDFIHGGLKKNVIEDCFLPQGIINAYRSIGDYLKSHLTVNSH